MLRLGASLLLLLAPLLSAQQPDSARRPSLAPPPPLHGHPVIDRSDYLTRRTFLAGAAIGIAAGLLQPTPRWSTGMFVGAGLGVLTGAIGGAVLRFNAPPPGARLELPLVGNYRDWARFVDYGARIGIGAGMVGAMAHGAGRKDDLDILLDQVVIIANGLMLGMIGGAIGWLFQH